jgi:hypothetical protein
MFDHNAYFFSNSIQRTSDKEFNDEPGMAWYFFGRRWRVTVHPKPKQIEP